MREQYTTLMLNLLLIRFPIHLLSLNLDCQCGHLCLIVRLVIISIPLLNCRFIRGYYAAICNVLVTGQFFRTIQLITQIRFFDCWILTLF